MRSFIRKLFPRPTPTVRTRQPARLVLEALDRRDLPSVTAALGGDGVLRVTGDDADDYVQVWVPGPGTVGVCAGAYERSFATTAVKRIEFRGAGGNDRFETAVGIPTLADGGAGNDTLESGGGNDTLIGGPGNDTYRFDVDRPLGSDVIRETYTGDTDALRFTGSRGVNVDLNRTNLTGRADGLVSDHLKLTLDGGWLEDVYGGGGDDVIVGSDWHNVLAGNGGRDDVAGRGGNDHLYGGDGDDVLHGGDGNDDIWGFGGNDWLNGDAGADILHGGDNNDRLGADGWIDDPGNDWMCGDAGDDAIRGGTGNDTLVGGAGNDHLGAFVAFTGYQGDALRYDEFDDLGDDVMYGDETDADSAVAGNDTVRGGTGNDVLYGGGGADVLGADRRLTHDNPVLDALDEYTSFCEDGDDVLYGNAGTDVLCGGEGNDTLAGGAGRDYFVDDRGAGWQETMNESADGFEEWLRGGGWFR